MKTILAAIPLLLLVTTSALGQVPDCGYATPCEAYAEADAVFVAKVIKIVPETIEIWQRDKDYDQIATVVIEKTYKGRKRNRLVFYQLGRKNAFKFVLGSRYLVYANLDRVTKKWEVKSCGSTRMVEYANDDLHYLDGLPASLKKTRIAGEVVRYETSADNPQGTSERLAGIKLKIIGNGKEYEAVTDGDGVYELYGVPAGSYTIQPDIPLGLTLLAVRHYGPFDRSKVRSLTIELKEGGCSGASIMFTPRPTLVTALPSDVRRWLRLAGATQLSIGLRPWSGLRLSFHARLINPTILLGNLLDDRRLDFLITRLMG